MSGLPVARGGIRQVDVHAVTRNETRRRDEGIVFLVLFALTIPAANWLIGHVGTVCQPAGPCLVPVAPGLMAPSGLIMAGAALVLRDLVQRRLGASTSSLAILAGARAARAHRCCGGVKCRRACRRLDRLSVASFRLARLPAGSDRREGMDGAALDPIRGLATPPRRAARLRLALTAAVQILSRGV